MKYLFFPLATPPFMPVINSPCDTSNFDVFEDDSKKEIELSNQNDEFSTKDLMFIGYSYTKPSANVK